MEKINVKCKISILNFKFKKGGPGMTEEKRKEGSRQKDQNKDTGFPPARE